VATETAKELESLLGGSFGGSVFQQLGMMVYRILLDINIAAVYAMGRFLAY
jgi:hypothetical protein